MAGPLLANNVSTSLQASIGPTDVTIVVANAAGLPLPGAGEWFYATLQSIVGDLEVVKCTARAGTSLTVQRGMDDTVATSFAAGSSLELRPCAQLFRDYDWRTARGAADGVAGLDGTSKVPVAQLPTNVNNGVLGLDGSAKAPVANLPAGVANGVCDLDNNVKVPLSRLPDRALITVTEWATEAAMLANSDAQEGDLRRVTADGKIYVRKSGAFTGTLSDWQLLSQPAPVTSVAGKTGAVTLVAADVSGVVPSADKNAANGVAGLGSNSRIAAAQAALSETVTDATTSRSLTAADHGKTVKFTNGSAIAVTAPDSLPDGFMCALWQAGAGQITVGVSGSVTLRARKTAKSAAQYALIGVQRIDGDIAVYGDVAAS